MGKFIDCKLEVTDEPGESFAKVPPLFDCVLENWMMPM